jgi:DNA polymerase (family 10)
VRRRKETIGDIDILVTCARGDRKKVIDAFVSLKDKKTVLAKGDTRASIILKSYGRQVDLRIVNDYEWGAGLLYFTGSKEHNVHLRTLAKEKNLKINEYGVFRIEDEKRVAGETEEEIYKLFGFQYIPPELREMHGEVEKAAKRRLPKLIDLKDIRGDMQMHSTWSDGEMDISELAEYVLKNYNYEYIVLTDHSQAARVAGGMNESEFRQQVKKIDAINKKLGKSFSKKGVEVDILANGKLDLADSLLAEMDWVCASIHSGFKKDNTERLIRACENPYVNTIGHPSGRLIGMREAYPVDWKKVINAAAQTGTALEINAEPDRMDLNDDLARMAREAGVMLTISTDSHSANNYEFMKLGVFVARRAWCTAGDILNTRSWKEIEKFVRAKRKMINNK